MVHKRSRSKVFIISCLLVFSLHSEDGAVKAFSPAPKTSIVQKPIRSSSASVAVTKARTQLKNNNRGTAQTHTLHAWPLTKDPKGMSADYPLAAGRIAITIGCTFFTWYAQKTNQYSSVMASSALTLICSMCFDRRIGQAAFCGSFAGMSSLTVIPSWPLALALGGITSFLFEALIHYRNAFLGIGGRLGATAFIGTSLVAACTGVSTGVSWNTNALSSLQLYSSTVVSMALWHAIGSIATIVLREASDDSAAADPVRASAVIGLIGALLLNDKTAALAVYGGSFVGMSLPSRLMHGSLPGSKKMATSSSLPKDPTVVSLLSAFAVAGILGGIVHGITMDLGFWPGG